MKRHLIVVVCLLTWFCSTHAADLAGAYLYGADLPYAVSPFTKRQAEQHQQAWADYLKTNITIKNSISMKLCLIPPGEFMMGSPESEADRRDNETQHLVRITKPFYLSATEVTQSQYQQVMGTNPNRLGTNPSRFIGANKPVARVSWNDAMEFCRKLSAEEGEEYRLPTEAEWEYACRAGTTTAYSFGDDTSQLEKYAWYKVNSGNTTHAVGKKFPNAWGLFDRHGNVWEWCQDRYAAYSSENVLIDPTGPVSGERRVLRGGSLYNPPRVVRSAYRFFSLPPVHRLLINGFRLARTCNLSP